MLFYPLGLIFLILPHSIEFVLLNCRESNINDFYIYCGGLKYISSVHKFKKYFQYLEKIRNIQFLIEN